MLETTLGQILVNEALPVEMRNYTRQLDSKGIKALLEQVAKIRPDDYSAIAKKLSDVGRDAAYTTGGQSFGIRSLRTPVRVKQAREVLRLQLAAILRSKDSEERKEERILETVSALQARLPKEVLEELKSEKNPLGDQVVSGSRGNPASLARLIAGDLLYVDHRDNPIPMPVTHGYAEGLSPAEWFAATFGARTGLRDVKFATRDAGFAAKQLTQAAHRLIVTADDDDDEEASTAIRGLPVDVTDLDNEGALLAQQVGPYPRNTVLTPKILQDLQATGLKRILVRSPIVGGPPQGGVYARDAGIRERSTLPALGDSIGIAAAQAIGERLAQGALSSKHGGGTIGSRKASSAFTLLNQMMQVSKNFKAGATHAQLDGRVESIRKTSTGVYEIMVDGKSHVLRADLEPIVKPGDVVEAGDVLSDGLPNPADIVQHKGIGEGRRYFTRTLTKVYRDANLPINRRNAELLARGLIDYVELTDEDDDHVPGDIVPYSTIERTWTPRQGYSTVTPKQGLGKHLERPVLHYTIGTQVKPSMVNEFAEFGINQIDVHDDPPPFVPRMVRGMELSHHDPDWMTRLLGSYQKKSLTSAAQRGSTSDMQGTSYVPSLAEGTTFGTSWPKNVLKT